MGGNYKMTEDKPEREIKLETLAEFAEKMLPSYFRTKYALSLDYFTMLDFISEYYKNESENIIELAKRDKCAYYNIYAFDWEKIFTPIESEAWFSIKTKGRIVLYPQYPVLNYHLDFANPYLKIALELDGAKYHDKEKDLKRDNNLRALGWTVYRISGREMNNSNYKNFADMRNEGIDDVNDIASEVHNWIGSTGDGVITAIRMKHFNDDPDYYRQNESLYDFYIQCLKTLEDHQLTENTIVRYNG